MIPKTIHYTWFSGDPYPQIIQKCIDSWHAILPDYEFKLWDMDTIRNIDSNFLKEAISVRKWAYAADFVRIYALYNEGGIYIDTDVQLYKTFNPFLENRAFIGKENSIHFEGRQSSQYLSSHCFGAEPRHPFLKDCLDYYETRHFIHSTNDRLSPSLRYNFVIIPFIQKEIAKQQYGYNAKPLFQEIQFCNQGLCIYPTDYFDPVKLTNNSICKHLALGSWREERSKEPIYNLRYKIEWRMIRLFEKILKRFNYVIMKIE